MTTPDRMREPAQPPYATAHAALVADLARTLPMAAGLATILGTAAVHPSAEPGQADQAQLVADLADTLNMAAGATDILHTEGGYAALLADVNTTVDLAAGLANILDPIAPNPALPGPTTTAEPITVGSSAIATTGVIEPTTQANLEKIAAAGGASRLLLRLNGRYRNLRTAIEAINDISTYLTHPAINLAADPSLDEIPATLIQHQDSLERVIAALANTLSFRSVFIVGVRQTLIVGGRQIGGIEDCLMEAEEEQIGDVEVAARLFREAADRGDAGAMRNLARLLLQAAERGDAGAWAGRLELSPDVARWVDLAAQRGDAGAQDLPRLLREAAEHGNAGALAGVARLIDQAAGSGDAGFLVRVAAAWEQVGDLDAAVRLLGEAADRGDAGAVRELARLRAEAGDLDGAVRLFLEAADRGDADAIRALALLREERVGGDIGGQVWYAAKSSDPADENTPADEITISVPLSSGEDLAVDTASTLIPPTEAPGQRRDRHDGHFPPSTVTQADAVLRQVAGSLQQLNEPGLIYRLSVAQREACRDSAASLALILDRISDALANFNGADLRDADIHHGDLEDTDGAHWRDLTSGEEPTRWPATIESQIIEHSEAVPWAPGEFVVRFGARISTPG
ncbi:tetratricopeptide repeat protein [Paractinoplanes globisporus]|uniref:Tetratricopeptide repeat protein n=1 Tax=Paractinoplanes globisporus TaxID=113565 RepID=A0ABW6WID3_9ACTN|nr:tetratricopeptide repeat protein [Actinoplanes globisporus]